ncbi:MAG: class I SAM-dependent methyltransferase [Verrucomicrobiae bacterium]|nr:class I SAM-dependent methyltransferase [Verrucomicrobiae bacterium]
MNNTQEKKCNTEKIFLTHDPRIEFFNSHAPDWDTSGPDIEDTLRKLDNFKPRLRLSEGMDVIEIGCGTGQITGRIADLVKPGKVLAVDFSPLMIEVARRKNISAEFKVMDICDNVIVEHQFDLALCFNSFPHFRDKIAALNNMRKLLRDNGILIVLHFSGSRQLNEFHKSVGGAVAEDFLPDKSEWDNLLSITDFKLIEFEDRPDLFFLRAVGV